MHIICVCVFVCVYCGAACVCECVCISVYIFKRTRFIVWYNIISYIPTENAVFSKDNKTIQTYFCLRVLLCLRACIGVSWLRTISWQSKKFLTSLCQLHYKKRNAISRLTLQAHEDVRYITTTIGIAIKSLILE